MFLRERFAQAFQTKEHVLCSNPICLSKIAVQFLEGVTQVVAQFYNTKLNLYTNSVHVTEATSKHYHFQCICVEGVLYF